LHAVLDISKGAEIEVSYISLSQVVANGGGTAFLREKFEFDCTCKGCTRPAAERQASTARLLAYSNFEKNLPTRYQTGYAPKILIDIEQQIQVACAEGHIFELGLRAHDAFQLCAMYGDAGSASQWEALFRDMWKVYKGSDCIEIREAESLVKHPRAFRQWGVLGHRKLSGPVSRSVHSLCSPSHHTAPS
jgi:hypothetical protein